MDLARSNTPYYHCFLYYNIREDNWIQITQSGGGDVVVLVLVVVIVRVHF